ncbi:MAG: hypothetical protein WBC26_01815 [Alphaproteobacteria bacterium]|nr:hypothetical protein [Alphaproteobacteria bacterium]
MNHSSLAGRGQDDEGYSGVLATVIAYSAINEGTRVFGDTGIRAFYDDANEFGDALAVAGAADVLTEYATDISKAFIQYAGLLAASHVTSALFSNTLEGVVVYDQATNPDVLSVRFSIYDWLPILTDLKDRMIVTQDGMVQSIFDDLLDPVDGGVDLYSFIRNNNWLSSSSLASGTAFNRVTFAALDSGSAETLSALHETLGNGRYKSTLYVGSSEADVVTVASYGSTGLEDSTVFLGYDGQNIFSGGDDWDIAIGGEARDEFNSGGGDDFLFGYDSNDLLKGGQGNDIVIGGTGNDDFIADKFGDDVYHGGFDTDELDPFWNGIPMDLMDITRQNDGLDLVDYTGLTDVFFDITLLDAALGNYWVDKYYGNAVFNGPSDRDTLFSIETLQVAAGAARQVGGQSILGTSAGEHLIYGSISTPSSYYGFGGVDTLTGSNKNVVNPHI